MFMTVNQRVLGLRFVVMDGIEPSEILYFTGVMSF